MAAMNSAGPDIRHKARRGLVVYFGVLIVLTAVLEAKLISYGENIGHHVNVVYLLMYAPAIASLVARLELREGIRDISFRFGGKEGARSMLLVWLFPTLVGFAAYGLAWATHLAQFRLPIRPGSSALYSPNPLFNFLASLAFMATADTVISCLSAAGEEIGWRGYMLTRLIDAGVPRPVLASGLIWGAWHTPLIVAGLYASGGHPLLSAALFVVNITALAYLAAYVRLRSGSIWPAILFHGAWNSIIQGTFDAATARRPLAVGESGYLVAIASVLLVAWIVRGKWKMFRRPGEPLGSAPPSEFAVQTA
jgi:CAAX protease family protein